MSQLLQSKKGSRVNFKMTTTFCNYAAASLKVYTTKLQEEKSLQHSVEGKKLIRFPLAVETILWMWLFSGVGMKFDLGTISLSVGMNKVLLLLD